MITAHGDILNFGSRADKQLFKRLASDVDHLVAVCNYGAEEIIKRGILKEKISVIANGVDINVFKSMDGLKLFLRQTLELPVRKKIFVTPARMTPYKGIGFLLDAVKRLRPNDAYFLVATPPTRYREDEMKYMNYLLAKAEENGVKDNFEIKFFDYSTMPFLYKASDFLILPSKTEQMPLAILEAMACEIPVIATRVGGIPELVKHRVNGLLVKYGNTKQLVEMIKAACRDISLMAFIRRRSRILVEQQYNSARMIADYEFLFKKLQNHKKNEEK